MALTLAATLWISPVPCFWTAAAAISTFGQTLHEAPPEAHGLAILGPA